MCVINICLWVTLVGFSYGILDQTDNISVKFLQSADIYYPVMLLVDDVKESHQDAATFLQSLYKTDSTVQNVNFLIMKFNDSAVTPILETTSNNKLHFEQVLTQDSHKFLGIENENKTAVFFAILHAVQNLPPMGTIVLFTKQEINDSNLVQLALQGVLKKKIKVYVIWGGKAVDPILRPFAASSGGMFFIKPYQYYHDFLEDFEKISTIISKRDLSGEYTIDFPIDSDVSGIHISITSNITNGVLITPNGNRINTLSGEVFRYSQGSFLHIDSYSHEIHLNTTTAKTQFVGLWHFRVNNNRNSYNVTIFVHTKLSATTNLEKNIIKLELQGNIASINNVSILTENGHKSEENSYPIENLDNIETNQEPEIQVEVPTIPNGTFYAKISGKDSQGHDFQRLSYVRSGSDSKFYLPQLSINIGSSSELITQSAGQPLIHFEVTNNGNGPVYVRFYCRDEKSNLRALEPWAAWISPQQTTIVRLTLITQQGSYRNRITFSAVASETFNKEVYVDVGTVPIDTHAPELSYSFSSNCIEATSCSDGTWTVEVKVKDTDSGLLSVVSQPQGLHFPTEFIAGTVQEVTGYYSASCCHPDVEIIALDRNYNRRTKKLNAYHANLGPWIIAAIVLIIVIILLIIIALICFCWRKKKCCFGKKVSGSYDIPTYKGPSGSKRF